MRLLTLCLLFSLAANVTHAEEAAVVQRVAPDSLAAPCSMNKTVTLSLNFNGYVQKATEVEALLSKQKEKVQSIAVREKLGKVTIQSQNFSINTNSSGYGMSLGYQYSGSIQFLFSENKKALFGLLDELRGDGVQVSLNVNEYLQNPQGGGC